LAWTKKEEEVEEEEVYGVVVEEVADKEDMEDVEVMAAERRPLSFSLIPTLSLPVLLLLLLLLLSEAVPAVAYLACMFQGTRAS
jgi:hypothetical protein